MRQICKNVILLQVNDWFDVFNVSTPMQDTRLRNRAYGLALEEQNTILDKFSEVISKMKVIGCRGQLPFQKGIRLNKFMYNQ